MGSLRTLVIPAPEPESSLFGRFRMPPDRGPGQAYRVPAENYGTGRHDGITVFPDAHQLQDCGCPSTYSGAVSLSKGGFAGDSDLCVDKGSRWVYAGSIFYSPLADRIDRSLAGTAPRPTKAPPLRE